MEELPRLRVVPSQMNSQPYWKSQSLKAILLGDPSFRSFCPRFHFTQVPHPKGLSHALTQYQGPLYTHFEKLPEAPTHALNLFLGGKMINTSGFRPHPPTWPGAAMGRPFCWRVTTTTWLTPALLAGDSHGWDAEATPSRNNPPPH